jgi:hypothetical protein
MSARRLVFSLALLVVTLPVLAADKPPGEKASITTKVLKAGAAVLQSNAPVKQLDIYLVGFHPMLLTCTSWSRANALLSLPPAATSRPMAESGNSLFSPDSMRSCRARHRSFANSIQASGMIESSSEAAKLLSTRF